jgi:Arf-GAP with SH3 domain, ANK repeat and PH domain-containing protein
VLDQGKLSEYTNWKQKLDLHMDPIDLRVASVREARNADRRFCFEIITPNFTRVYQATSEDDMKSWIYTINNALQSAVESSKNSGPVLDSPSGSGRKDFASALTGKSNSQRVGYGGHRMVGRHATVGDRPASRPTPDANNESSQKLLQLIRDADLANKVCADCGSDSKVDWVSINLGVIICIECSGIHRSLGTHISKVRSLTLDPNAFTPDVIEILLTLGNRHANSIWEAAIDSSSPTSPAKPTPQASRDQRLRFITAKYTERAFVEKLSPSRSHFPTADETLLASIKKNAIRDVAYALALHANPNVVDRSRGTHAVFLALAAADPAAPSPIPSPPSSGMKTGDATSGSSSTPVRKVFPVAELLLLNGADLPLQTPPIPLSRASRDYLEAKVELRSGRRPGNPSQTTPVPSTSSRGAGHLSTSVPAGSTISAVPRKSDDLGSGVGTGGDTLTALPVISDSGPALSMGSPGQARTPGERKKRLSSGGKLVKPGGPLSSFGGS